MLRVEVTNGSARSRSELSTKLARKGVPAEVAARLLDRFEEVGLVDDQAFARSWVESRHAGGQAVDGIDPGPGRIDDDPGVDRPFPACQLVSQSGSGDTLPLSPEAGYAGIRERFSAGLERLARQLDAEPLWKLDLGIGIEEAAGQHDTPGVSVVVAAGPDLPDEPVAEIAAQRA